MTRFTTATLAALVASATLVACDTQNQVFSHTTQASSAITEVVVNVDVGTVAVTSAVGGTKVKSAAVARWIGEKPEVEFIEEGTRLTISATCAESNEFCDIDLAFEMPAGAVLKIEGSTLDVKVEDAMGPTTIAINEGDITLARVSGNLDVDTHKGTVTGTDLKSSRGWISSWSGKLDLAFVGPIFNIQADTNFGDIKMKVPYTAYTVEAKTGDGDLNIGVKQDSNSRRLIHAVATERGNVSINY